MTNKLSYKGYKGIFSYSKIDGVYFGKIMGISDLINYESKDVYTIFESFKQAVDEYIEFCKEIGK